MKKKMKCEDEALKNQYLEDIRNKAKVLDKDHKALLFYSNVVERTKYGVSFEELHYLIFGEKLN